MKINNPIIWADYPDPDIIRIGDAYYMITTTMFFMPAAPIMKSVDLVHWEIVTYVTDRIDDAYDQVGAGYGRGQWATSLREHKGRVYAFFSCLDIKKSFLFYTDDIEKRNWDSLVFEGVYHDATLLFDDRAAYLIYKHGTTQDGDIRILQFKDGMSGMVEGSDRPLFVTPMEGIRLAAEGTRGLYLNGWYYLFFIDIPEGGLRREWCYRAREVEGPYERRLIADSTVGHRNRGVAQGMVVDTPAGDWFMILFGDAGAVGRIPFLFPVTWQEDWPVVGGDAGMQLTYDVPLAEGEAKPLIYCDSFGHAKNEIALFWQWNHNPDDNMWSFTENPGALTLHAAPADGLLQARNTLSQRTCGPGCSFTVQLDASDLQPGDEAGLAAMQWDFATMGVVMEQDGTASMRLVKRTIEGRTAVEGPTEELLRVPAPGRKLQLKAVFDFVPEENTVQFYYAPVGTEQNGAMRDNADWMPFGEKQPIHFNLRYFVGTRIALYCFGSGGGQARWKNFVAEVIE